MQIVYTPDIFTRQRVGGISRYFVEIVRHLAAGGSNVRVVAGSHCNQHLRELDGDESLIGCYKPAASRFDFKLGLRRHFQEICEGSQDSIVHHTYYSFRRPSYGQRFVATVYDMIPERFPHQFGWKARLLSAAKRRTCRLAERILVISHTTKSDLVSYFDIDPDRIDVTYLGNSLLPYRELNDPRPLTRPYLLYVGNRKGYKNCRVLFEAIAQSPRLKGDFSILCFGGGSFCKSERTLIDRLGLSDSVFRIDGDDRELANCYQHAEAFVYPSIYEGFGIPPIEAMSFGCPVIASNGGAIPEVVGTGGIYFDPNDSKMLADRLESVVYDEQAKDKLRQEMSRRESGYRWENTARETLRCYEKAAA